MFTTEYKDELEMMVQAGVEKAVKAIGYPALMTTETCARYLDITETALRQKRSNGHIPDWITKKIGGCVYYVRKKVDQWLDE